MYKVLIDTDVIRDFFFDRKSFAENSAEILILCEENKLSGFTTSWIISNVYYLLRKTVKHDIIVEKIKQFLSIIEIIKMDKNILRFEIAVKYRLCIIFHFNHSITMLYPNSDREIKYHKNQNN